MTTLSRQVARLAALASVAVVAAVAFPARGADGDETFDAAIERFRYRSVVVDEWQNNLMASGTGRYSSQSADEVLTAALRDYTRDVLDRGYWVNAWVNGAPGYDSGNPLFAVAQGEGVTLRAANPDAGDARLGGTRDAVRFSTLGVILR